MRFDASDKLSDTLLLSYQPHECKVELEHDKVFLNKSHNHIRLTFTLSPNIELEFGRYMDEEEIGLSMSFTHHGKESIESDGSPIPSPLRKFGQDSINAV